MIFLTITTKKKIIKEENLLSLDLFGGECALLMDVEGL